MLVLKNQHFEFSEPTCAVESSSKWLILFLKNGADERNRTGDLRFTKALLYQLSYIGITFYFN
jgi:hypothetical protein